MEWGERHMIEILHCVAANGRKYCVVWNTRTNFQQMVRKLKVARKVEAHWISREAIGMS